MNFNEYQALALRTEKSSVSVQLRLLHAQIGMATESGEFATEVKRAFFYEKPITDVMIEHMKEEVGDLLWYVAVACAALETTIEQVAIDNINKLQERFPDKFTIEAAEARADKGGLDAQSS